MTLSDGNRLAGAISLMLLAAAIPRTAGAQTQGTPPATLPATVACNSAGSERQHCPADTSGGIALLRATGSAPCLLGRNWGYDDQGVWVAEGSGGEFVLGQSTRLHPPSATEPLAAAAPAAASPPVEEGAATAVEVPQDATPEPAGPGNPTERIETWGVYDPGTGFLVARNKLGELSLSGYAMVRYLNQNDQDQVFTDHLGNQRAVDPRNDIYSHRVMVFLKGWMGDPKMVYTITLWTVNATDQRAIFANLGYQFSKKFSLYAGLTGNPGTRSILGSHPYWLAHDRVMADEFFRPFFGSGVYAVGEVLPGLWYTGVLSTSSSSLGVKSSQLDRKYTSGASVWWMPTTREFGPRGAYGDWEMHDKVATRFGMSYTTSPEQSFRSSPSANPENTTLRFADSVNVFETGALAPGVTIDTVDAQILAVDAGMKFKGLFLQAEYYQRQLDNFAADGPLPNTKIVDRGFYLQAAFYPIPRKLELYGITSQIYGDKDAGFDNSSEYGVGMNWYPFDTRNHRLNLQVLDVNKSPVSSAFGYYVGGQDGINYASSFSIFF